jgi:hypothetical protein
MPAGVFEESRIVLVVDAGFVDEPTQRTRQEVDRRLSAVILHPTEYGGGEVADVVREKYQVAWAGLRHYKIGH